MANPQPNATILYPVDHISQIAAQILTNASTAQQSHDTAWQDLQTYIRNTFAPAWHDTVINLITPYVNHLRASYDWQIDLASALFDATEVITGTDNNIAQHFHTDHYHGFQ
jgi:hypothetical protein